jgi:hypothetical protein
MEGLVVMTGLRRAAVALAGLALFAAASPALAWGDLGHRVVADLAYERLTPAARRQVDALLAEAPVSGEPSCPVASFSDAAVFADCVDGIRRYNDMRRLHFEAAPLCGPPVKANYCKDGACASEAIKRAQAVLADPVQPAAARLLALEQIANFVADLHQPTNMIDNRDDRGADIRIALPGSADRRLNFHDFWNDILLAPSLGGEDIGVRYLEPVARSGRGWDEGDVDAWATETQGLARQIYARLPEPPQCGRNPKGPEVLDRGYVLAAVPQAREQLAKAGIRLATLLNATLR